MPVKTVTILVQAMTDRANAQIKATGTIFDELRAKSPIEMQVKFDKAQALAESRILAREMSATVRDVVKLQADGVGAAGMGALLRALRPGGAGVGGLTGIASLISGGGLLGGATGVGVPGAAAAGAGGIGAAGIGIGSIAGIGLLYTGLLGIVPALAAAGAGVAAFGGLAIPTFTAVTAAISGVSAANAKFQEAAQNVDIAISTSAADMKVYRSNLAALPPGLAAAEKLLGNTSVTWQGLTASQQNNVIALSQNSAALKVMLPAQRTALAQLLASKAVWDQLSPAQQKVAIGWQNVSTAFQDMAAKLAPDVLGIMASGLKAISALMPAILPLAKTAGDALGGLASRLGGFFALTTTTTTVTGAGQHERDVLTKTLTPFGQFVAEMTKLAGPAITTLGDGFGKIAVSLGKLLEAMANPNGIKVLRVALEGIAGLITGIAWIFDHATPRVISNIHEMASAFDHARHDIAGVLDFLRARFEQWGHDIVATNVGTWHHITNVFDGIRHDVAAIWNKTWDETIGRTTRGIADVMLWVSGLPGKIMNVFRSAGTWLYNTGRDVLHGFLGGLTSLWDTVTGWFSNLGHTILSAIKGVLGIHSPSAAFFTVGAAIMQGLLAGLKSESAHLLSFMEGLASSVLGKATGGFSPGTGLSGSANSNMVLMQQMARARGWTGDQWTSLFNVEMAEAGFSMTATNPGSGAYGMAQFIGGPQEYYQWGGNPNTAAGQITGMLNYISSRYGNPGAAWAHEQAFHWYDAGGMLPPGLSLALNTTGKAEVIAGSGLGRVESLLDEIAGRLAELTAVAAAAPAATGAGIGAALGMGARSAMYGALYP